MKLNARQKTFVKEYLVDKNATRAAKAAGYSKKSAKQMGTENLAKPSIRKAIDAGLAKQATKADISADRVIARIAQFAFDKKSIKPSDILKACELLGRRFKLFTDVTEVSGKDGGPQVIAYIPDNGKAAKK